MSQKDTDNLNWAALMARLTEYEQLDPPERLVMARREIGGHMVFTLVHSSLP